MLESLREVLRDELVCTIVGAGLVSPNSERSACRCMASVVVSLMAIISASHTFNEVESNSYAHYEIGQPPNVNTHLQLERWFVSAFEVGPKE